EKNIEVIYNGIDLARFSGAALAARQNFRQLLGLGEKPLVGIIARLSDVKGHCYLIQAMPRVLRRFPEAKLLIIGEGKTESSLREQVRSLEIEKSVIFMPTAEDTAAALAAMDVFVLPSLQEGLGLSLMEAMASGLAVVGSAVGGIQDLLRQDENGLLVERANADALATEIIGLLSDGEKRRRLGSAARKSMQEKFSQERMCLETERVYLKCVNKEN
ncbi:MAG: glycosyltransferase family 4 protein, partial [Candidatus Omnitrophica bacterium]|nr:glycosyltransferase family 4 protein [Candidatus Omnitrophota bacterium]